MCEENDRMIKKINDFIYFVGILNPNSRVSDVIVKMDFGTSYNSFIIKDKKIALVETCKHEFIDSYLENIRQVCDLNLIDYIILNHTEPDHSGALKKIIELAPNAKIICSQAGTIYLKNILNQDLDFVVARDNFELELGENKIKFVSAPFLHWPDSMFSLLENKNFKAVFSCDFLGCHFCEPEIFDYKIKFTDSYNLMLENYFKSIFGPFKKYVLSGLEKIENQNLDFVFTSHGPILTKNNFLEQVIKKYKSWALSEKAENKYIAIFYCSAYGNTFKLAEQIKNGILESNNMAKVKLFNVIEHDLSVLQNELNSCDAFLIGTPTINRDAVAPVWNLLAGLDVINSKNKNAAVFGSFGWSGEATDFVFNRLRDLKLKVFDSKLKINFVPSERDLDDARNFGFEFASNLI